MDADQIPCLFDDQPCSRICYRKNYSIWLDLFIQNVAFEPVGNLLRKEHGFGLLAAFGVSDVGFPLFDINRREFQDLPDPHAAAGHEFQHQSVPLIHGSENYLVDHILFEDLEKRGLTCPEQFAQCWIVTWIFDFRIEGVFHEIEKGRQEGETKFLGILFGPISDRGHESQDVLGCNSGYLYITEMVLEIAKDELIIA